MAGSYDLRKNDKGQFNWVLKAGNGQVILQSEQYESKASAQNGIASVQKNSPDDARFDRRTAKNGKPYFVLKAGNGQIIGTSEMYESEAGRDNGIESVKTNGPSTNVKDLTAPSA
jgi:hypothetical protein